MNEEGVLSIHTFTNGGSFRTVRIYIIMVQIGIKLIIIAVCSVSVPGMEGLIIWCSSDQMRIFIQWKQVPGEYDPDFVAGRNFNGCSILSDVLIIAQRNTNYISSDESGF
ncbi:hypothetical protein D3C75_1008550 [compost metagenome]